MTSPSNSRVIAVFGPPGAGKTTVARALCEALDRAYVGSGDVARRVDPEAIARGEMADRALLRAGFVRALLEAGDCGVVVDGLPRDEGDLAVLPEVSHLILLNCELGTAIARQVSRQRPGDTLELATKRTREQRMLMQLDDREGWAYRATLWQSRLNTTALKSGVVIEQVLAYVTGNRKSIA